MKKKIAFIVCSNGYGHLKRDIAIILALQKKNPSLHFDIFCQKKLIHFALNEINFKLANINLNYHHDATVNEINWLNGENITILKYNKWLNELKNNPILNNADLILSDNHVLPLRIFTNARLIGSFLWHDVNVFSGMEAKQIAEEERDFIKKRKPDMFCVGVMAMSEVLSNTNPIKLPWYCNKLSKNKIQILKKAILVTGGGTSLITDLLTKYTLLISAHIPEWDIFVDSKLYNKIGEFRPLNVKQFKFTDKNFLSLSAIVCRPGIGILDDCVKYCIPAVVIGDVYNSEINHNAKRVKELGIGISFEFDTSVEIIVEETVDFINDDLRMNILRSNLQNQLTGGAELCADYIINLIK